MRPPGLPPELMERPPDSAPWVGRDCRGVRAGQVAGIREGPWLVTGARLIAGARSAAVTRFVALTTAFPSAASRATV